MASVYTIGGATVHAVDRKVEGVYRTNVHGLYNKRLPPLARNSNGLRINEFR